MTRNKLPLHKQPLKRTKTKPASNGNHAGGTPTIYNKEMCKWAYKFCLLGCTNEEISNHLEISIGTFEKWYRDKGEFFRAIRAGREEADAKVAHKMYSKALGYSHKEDEIFQYKGETIIVPTVKHYPPDVAAAKMILMNRHPDKWKEKQAAVSIEKGIDSETIKITFE
jgi:hypothetical protein